MAGADALLFSVLRGFVHSGFNKFAMGIAVGTWS